MEKQTNKIIFVLHPIPESIQFWNGMAIQIQKLRFGMSKTTEYYVILVMFLCCGLQQYSAAVLGSFAGKVLGMTVHSDVVEIV